MRWYQCWGYFELTWGGHWGWLSAWCLCVETLSYIRQFEHSLRTYPCPRVSQDHLTDGGGEAFFKALKLNDCCFSPFGVLDVFVLHKKYKKKKTGILRRPSPAQNTITSTFSVAFFVTPTRPSPKCIYSNSMHLRCSFTITINSHCAAKSDSLKGFILRGKQSLQTQKASVPSYRSGKWIITTSTTYLDWNLYTSII